MTWVKLEDGFYDNPKVLAAGFDGAGLYAMCIAYCGRHLTDGFVPEPWLKRIGAKPGLRSKLVMARLWYPVDGGFQIPDYTRHNRSKQEVEARRLADRVRKDSRRNPRGVRKDSTRIEVEAETEEEQPLPPEPYLGATDGLPDFNYVLKDVDW